MPAFSQEGRHRCRAHIADGPRIVTDPGQEAALFPDRSHGTTLVRPAAWPLRGLPAAALPAVFRELGNKTHRTDGHNHRLDLLTAQLRETQKEPACRAVAEEQR